MFEKRGQASVFIVLGLFLVLIVVLLLYFRSSQQAGEFQEKTGAVTHFSTSALKVKPYVTDCIEKQAVIALILASKTESGNLSLPPLDILEKSISNYVNDNIILCTHFSMFREFNISPGNVNTSVHVYSKNVVIDVNWPLKLVQGDLTLYENEFRVSFSLKLSELYEKVRSVVEHNTTLDAQHILSQNLNVEIIECENNSIRYMVNDKDYLLDENVLRFFFSTGIENLSDLFEFNNGLRYVPYGMPGRNILMLAGENKTLSFGVSESSYVSGCFAYANESEYYTYSVVKNNKIPVSISLKGQANVSFKEEPISESRLLLESAYNVNLPANANSVITFRYEPKFIVPQIYVYDGGWKEIESVQHGNYVSANITESGRYAVGSSVCAVLNKGSGLTIAFVSVDYNNMSKFTAHAYNYTQTLLSTTPMSAFREKFNIVHILKNNTLSCLSFDSENCSASVVESETNYCAQNVDYVIALVDNTLVGLDHKTEGNVSYIGSYLTLDPDFCSACGFIREFGKYMGLADEFAYLGNTTLNSTYPNCDSSFSGREDLACPKWRTVEGAGCYPGCIYENWYRPERGFVLSGNATSDVINVTHNIMRGDLIDGQKLRINSIYFDPVSEKYLRDKISQW
jgi:hypothetical protein